MIGRERDQNQASVSSRVRAVELGNPPYRLLCLVCGQLLLIPLVFGTAFYRNFTFPKMALLLTGSAAILLLIAFEAAARDWRALFRPLRSWYVALALLYLMVVALSTVAGISPLASLFGSYTNQMGLITRVCFFIHFAGIVIAIDGSTKRFQTVLWSMAIAGFLAAAYAVMQFAGLDPFLSARAYTFASADGPIIRVPGTLGHSNYLGNFLLFTTALSAGLAAATTGGRRHFAFLATIISVIAIAASGTRGAWLGLVIGAIVFGSLVLKLHWGGFGRSPRFFYLGLALSIAILIAAFFALVPNSPSFVSRGRSLAADGFTGSGRVLLWRDAIRMAPDFWLFGTGPEGFTRVFPAYRSPSLARYAPDVNNESAHNLYLDAGLSFGVPGVISYLALLATTFILLVRTWRNVDEPAWRPVLAGLISSLVGVSIHNFFIHDQISTGLYFFAFAALTACVPKVSNTDANVGTVGRGERTTLRRPVGIKSLISLRGVPATAAAALLLVSALYAVSLGAGDIAIRRAFDSARNGDFDGLVQQGTSAERAMSPTYQYRFLFARALALYSSRLSFEKLLLSDFEACIKRSRAVEMAISRAENSVTHSLRPESNYVLLAYLANMKRDGDALRSFAAETIRLDPNLYTAHWLLAEALTLLGDLAGAEREARVALDLNPGCIEARLILIGARLKSPETAKGNCTLAPAGTEKLAKRP